MGRTLRLSGEFKAAEKSLKQAISINGDYAYAHYNLALVYESMEKIDRAIHRMRKAVILNPDDMDLEELDYDE